jgi:NAD(P)-dependent dehydrogenase (short-subunit alcohol dehydrogenase family)
MRDFENRHVVVTGGTGALGSAVVGALLERGARCHVSCLDDRELKAFEHGSRERVEVHHPIDLTREEDVVSLYAGFGPDTGLWASLHIAGGFSMGPIESVAIEAFAGLMRMNSLTCFLCCREAVKAMRRSGDAGGRIVNVAARPALFPELGGSMVAYTASKAAVAAITQSLADEVAPDGILVNAIVPSIIDTPANRKAMPEADHDKWPKPAEIAETIVYLASSSNRSTRAALVPVYGRS